VVSTMTYMLNQCSVCLDSHLFCQKSCFIYVICIYLCILVSNTFPFQMIFMSFKINTTGVTSGAGSANPSASPSIFKGVLCCSIFSFLCNVL
jgi:hypothetical protein